MNVPDRTVVAGLHYVLEFGADTITDVEVGQMAPDVQKRFNDEVNEGQWARNVYGSLWTRPWAVPRTAYLGAVWPPERPNPAELLA